MKILKSLLILIVSGLLLPSPVKCQVARVCDNTVAYNSKATNCIWLSNLTAKEIKAQYESRSDYKPEKVVAVNDKTSEGYRLYYKHQGKRGWQKYCITITTIKTSDCIDYYQSSNPDLLMLPFKGIKELVGKFGHTSADFKKIYKKYEHLACRVYKQVPDNKGVLNDEMTVLLQKYIDSVGSYDSNLMASGDNSAIAAVTNESAGKDTWDYWLSFLEDLETRGFTTLIEYSTCPLDQERTPF